MTTSINSTGAVLGTGWSDPRGIFGSVGSANTMSTTTMLGNAPIQTISAVREQELKHAAMDTPIYTLLNLWVARYGNEWVDLEEIKKDDFFAIAHKRLAQMGQLEQHYLTDRARFVCRKPE